jgi:hypothetical protein
VRGITNNTSYERMRVHVWVSRETKDPRTSGFFVDVLELYSARQRNAFVEQAAEEIAVDPNIVKRDLGLVLLHLESKLHESIQEALKPKDIAPEMNDADRASALALLRDPSLVDRILTDLDSIGVVGETNNKMLTFLAAVSRKLPDPLAVLVQSSSAAGKTSLVDAVLSLVPEEDRVEYSAMTGQALFYVEPGRLRHKVLSIAEEAGAERASYALKLLQSAGSLTIASTAKEAGTGRLTTHEYKVEGPVALMMTTTATEIDDELANRCVVLSVNESREQTKAIHRRQRDAETLDGLLARQRREHVLALHRNAQRLLRTIPVVNPFAPELTFIDGSTRARRDHRKYLTLIRAIALLHQHQREPKRAEEVGAVVEYIEATKADIELAGKLLEGTTRTLDELPPHTRHVLGLLEGMVTTACTERGIERTDYRFTRREMRERLDMGSTQAKVHLRRLVEAEYVIAHGSKHGRGVVYELAYTYDATGRGSDGHWSGHGRPMVGGRSGHGRGVEKSIPHEKTSQIAPDRSGSSGSRIRSTSPETSKSRRTATSNGAG